MHHQTQKITGTTSFVSLICNCFGFNIDIVVSFMNFFFFWFSHPPIKKGKKPLKKFELDSLYLGRKPRVIPRGYLFSCSLLLSWYFKCWSWLMGVVIYNVVRAWEHWEAIVILAFKFSNKWVNGETNNDLLGILRSLRYPSNYKCGGSRDQFTPATSGCYR